MKGYLMLKWYHSIECPAHRTDTALMEMTARGHERWVRAEQHAACECGMPTFGDLVAAENKAIVYLADLD